MADIIPFPRRKPELRVTLETVNEGRYATYYVVDIAGWVGDPGEECPFKLTTGDRDCAMTYAARLRDQFQVFLDINQFELRAHEVDARLLAIPGSLPGFEIPGTLYPDPDNAA